MRKNKIKERIYTVAFMLIVPLVSVSAVSGLHLATLDVVKRNEDLFLRKAVLKAAGIEIPKSPTETVSLYDRLIKPLADVQDCYAVEGEGSKYVFVRSGPGLWGDITAVVCFDMEAQSLAGITFTKQNETPGLGARIDEDWFQTQFRGKKAPLSLVPEGSKSDKIGEIDAITGATITSKAVRDIVNRTSVEAAAMKEKAL